MVSAAGVPVSVVRESVGRLGHEELLEDPGGSLGQEEIGRI